MGIAMRARARIQINLAVSQVVDIKQVANFPDIVFPILWFEEVSFLRCYIIYLTCLVSSINIHKYLGHYHTKLLSF